MHKEFTINKIIFYIKEMEALLFIPMTTNSLLLLGLSLKTPLREELLCHVQCLFSFSLILIKI